MTTTPAVTVVIPAYNAARHLGATLDSVLAQRGVELEVVVVDDRSTDGTAALIQAHAERDARLRYACTPSNCGGPAGPRNLGVGLARAEWVAFCDSDDLWHPDKLRRQLEAQRNGSADLVCTAIQDFRDGTTPVLPTPTGAGSTRALRWASMLLKNRIATSSVLVRRALVQSAGGFAVDRELVAVEDYDLWLRLLALPGVRGLRLDEALVAYRRLPGSLSGSKLRQARKVRLVLRRAFDRHGWSALFPLAAPLLMLWYGLSSVYLRLLHGRL